MLRHYLLCVMIVVSGATLASAQEIPAPKLTAAEPSEKHSQLIREGVALHDQGRFEAAVEKYNEVLKENPDVVLAIYEMGFSYFSMHQFQKSLDIAYRGAQYKSPHLPGLYTLIGNNLDEMGQSDKAISVYKEAIKSFPSNALLHFNLGVALCVAKKLDEGRSSFRQALVLEPDYASPHVWLSQVYFKTGYRIPALLAALRFLLLEPGSKRSEGALQIVRQVLGSGVEQKEPGKISITLDPSAKTDEGDFNADMAAISLVGAGRFLEKNEKKSETQLFVYQMTTVLSIMSESSQKSSGFAWDYYRPYFSEMSRKKLVEPFCYYILQSSGAEEVTGWLGQHPERVRELLNWSKDYRWKR